ncbi:Fusaric acid resistance protein-like-domain-containing protein [Zychaea mexicana]|uniref:Fusaric acid resistance protein-like-domain-containing protein n=1 Tax=Zychaea mexicana TaxID=64656 RepID=UPI0022FEB57A|nr:Fusaric acid resistance protein-like-domain-containing protein [Zychaea mexicana]KAI9497668.1 Fusaric acid resistance protein-like-domain-containing protein [Zychaea mexicana]
MNFAPSVPATYGTRNYLTPTSDNGLAASLQSYHTATGASVGNKNSTPTTTNGHSNGWWIPQQSYHHQQHPQRYGPHDSSVQLSKSPTSFLGTFSDDYNYFEVVLDDGTRQKRSVSLSTVPLYFDGSHGNGNGKARANYNSHYTGERQVSVIAIAVSFINDIFCFACSPTETTALLPKNSAPTAPQDHYEDTSSDSDAEDQREQPVNEAPSSKPRALWARIASWHNLSHKQKMVLKCSFAYALGALFTFVPVLNRWIGGTSVSSHVVCTVTVFFNPAKTLGGMVEAAGFGLLYAVLALSLCLLSLATSDYLMIDHHLYMESCVVTLGVFLAGSTFVISFFKAHLNKPSIRTASSLAFIIIFCVLVRETSSNPQFNTTKIEQTFFIVIIGTAISVAVCVLIWPVRSIKKLKTDIDATLMSIRILLKLLTKTFIMDADLPEFTANKQLEDAIKSHRSSFVALQNSLKEAKLEFYSMEMWCHADGYDKTVTSLQRLAQHISGLRSSCGLQFEAMQEIKTEQQTVSKSGPGESRQQQQQQQPQQRQQTQQQRPAKQQRRETINVKADNQRRKMEHELRREHSIEQNLFYMEGTQSFGEEVTGEDGESEGALVQFIRTQTIIHLQARFTGNVTSRTPSFEMMKQNLNTALEVFDESQERALMHLYRRKKRNHDGNKRQRQESWQNMDPSQLHSYLMKQFPAEDVFLVYFFVFCMVEFAKELVVLTEYVQSIYGHDYEMPTNFWQRLKSVFKLMFSKDRFSLLLYHIARRPGDDLPSNEKTTEEVFVPNNNNTHNTLQTPSPTTRIRKFFLKLWGFFSWFRSHTVKYAIKASVVSVAIGMLAFIPSTQFYFREFRMEWTLISIMTVSSPTVGGTNVVAVLRVLATIFGCIVAAAVYTIVPAHPLILLLITWAFSVPCFHIILNHKYGRFGQFALLAYNLIVLYSYNHREDYPMSYVYELAWKRCVSVSLGVIIGLIVTAYIWPYEARKELRKGLSDLLLHLSWLYKQLVSVYSETSSATNQDAYSLLIEEMFYDTHNRPDYTPTPEQMKALAARNKIRAAQFQKIELALQVNLVTLRELLTHAPNEPRLKGPFPVQIYESMLTSCQNILDKFLSMRIVILKDVWAIQVRRSLMLPASKEWMDMAGNILLYFYLLASALQLKTPLPPYLPPAEMSREVLMTKLEQVLPSTNASSDDSYMVYYAYVAMMENIIQDLDKLGSHMKGLYGTLVSDDHWARCFGLLDASEVVVNSGFDPHQKPSSS